MRSRRWFWITLFICMATLVSLLATTFNVVLAKHYPRWLPFVFGALGFLGILFGTALFFLRLLKEMRRTQMQSEFLAKVSHELKTPLSSIELAASLLKNNPLSEEERDRLWEVHDIEVKRLRAEVEALLEAAQWDSKSVHVRLEPVNLEAWLERSLRRWKTYLGTDAELIRTGEKLDQPVPLNTNLLDLIGNNLIENARKFSRNTPKVRIETRIVPAAKPGKLPTWRIRFSDQGMGFPPNLSQKIFNRFFRARTPVPYAIPGNGLGLYLAASASRALKLSLKAGSEGVDKGATFTLEGQWQN